MQQVAGNTRRDNIERCEQRRIFQKWNVDPELVEGLVRIEIRGVQRQNPYLGARPRSDFTGGESCLTPRAIEGLDIWLPPQTLRSCGTEFGLSYGIHERPRIPRLLVIGCGVFLVYTKYPQFYIVIQTLFAILRGLYIYFINILQL
jgi:hypothetical protein